MRRFMTVSLIHAFLKLDWAFFLGLVIFLGQAVANKRKSIQCPNKDCCTNGCVWVRQKTWDSLLCQHFLMNFAHHVITPLLVFSFKTFQKDGWKTVFILMNLCLNTSLLYFSVWQDELLASLISLYTFVHSSLPTAPQPPTYLTAGKLSKLCPHKVITVALSFF